MKLKTLLRIIDDTEIISVICHRTYEHCDINEYCENCEYDDVYGLTGGCDEHKHIVEETETIELFSGNAEDVPYKLTELNVYGMYSYIKGQGKNGRKKHGTESVIQIMVEEYEH